MPSELLPTMEVAWPFAAGAAVGILALVVIAALWRGQSVRRQAVRAYDREQRALEAFRHRLAGDDAVAANRPPRPARGGRAARRRSPAPPGPAGVKADDRRG
jgi:hypothetical protein